MKNVEDVFPEKNFSEAVFFQRDHQIEKIVSKKGLIIIPASLAWEKYKWTQKFFEKKPKEGYFVWLKKQIDFPLYLCVGIFSSRTSQELGNLLVVEPKIKAKIISSCFTQKSYLRAGHRAQGKVVLKKGSQVSCCHFHRWGRDDFVQTDYSFDLEDNSSLSYFYKCLFPAKNLFLKNSVFSQKNTASNLKLTLNASRTRVRIDDSIVLAGKNAQGLIKLKIVGRKNSVVEAESEIVAREQAKGHLDCQGLLIEKGAKISMSPKLICQDKRAQLTHEASIGKISEQELIYLRQRGIKEDEAISLIVNGFLN